MVDRILTHSDAADFDAVFDGFIFGDRPEWWTRPQCVWLFEPLGSGPDLSFFACDLDEAVEDLWANHYDIAGATVSPQLPRKETKKLTIEPHAMPKAAWRAWREERDSQSHGSQVRAIRSQLFTHLPRSPEAGCFGFSELPASVRALDRYEACRLAARTVQEALDDIEVCREGLRDECARIFGRMNDAGASLAVALTKGPDARSFYLEVPEKVIRQAVRGSAAEAAVADAYQLMEGYPRFRGQPPRFDSALPRPRWRAMTVDRQRWLLDAEPEDFQESLEPANAWYRDYLEAQRVHSSRSDGRRKLLVRVADQHCDHASNLQDASAAFDPDSSYYLAASFEEALSAARTLPGTYFGLLDVERQLRH